MTAHRHTVGPDTSGPGPNLVATIGQLRRASRLHVVLDYDGTLVPFAPVPELAGPDEELLDLLMRLSVFPATTVHLLSGHHRSCMEAWFGHLPLVLHAEDGYWSRTVLGGAWIAAGIARFEWKEAVGKILADVTRRTHGSFVERKTAALAWHYRLTDPILAVARLSEARRRIRAMDRGGSFELIDGPMVFEVRQSGVGRRRIAGMIGLGSSTVLAAGDDMDDEYLFEALPKNALTVHVGSGPTLAGFSVPGPEALRSALWTIVAPGT